MIVSRAFSVIKTSETSFARRVVWKVELSVLNQEIIGDRWSGRPAPLRRLAYEIGKSAG
jgi:hypothetical protein